MYFDSLPDELVDLVVRENGKNRTEALASVLKGNETVEYACSLPQVVQGRTLQVSRGITCQEVRDPLGVVACIVPFNFPVMVPLWTIPIALTMGNCVILKPSEKVVASIQAMFSSLLLLRARANDVLLALDSGAVDNDSRRRAVGRSRCSKWSLPGAIDWLPRCMSGIGRCCDTRSSIGVHDYCNV